MALRRRILEYDMNTLEGQYNIIKKAKNLCKEQTLAQVKEISVGAGQS